MPKRLDPLDILNRDMDRSVPHGVSRQLRPKPALAKPVHPRSLAALEAHRAKTQLDQANGIDRQRCKHCRRVVVKGLDVCYFHGGAKIVLARRRAKGQPVSSQVRTARRNLRALFARELVPPELFRVPLFMSVAKVAVPKAFGLPQDYARTRYSPEDIITATLLAREMAAAWITAQRGDPLAWTRVAAKARKLGFE